MARPFVLLLALALAGCPSGGGTPGRQPSWRAQGDEAPAATPRVIELRPVSVAATAYNDPPLAPAPRSKLGDVVVAAVERAAVAVGRTAPRADGRLFQVAAELARVAPDDAPLSYGLTEFALQHAGIIEPTPHLVVIRAPIDEPEAIVEKLDERLPGILGDNQFARVGVGAAERDGDEDVIVLALQASFITTRPVPRRLAAQGKATLEGEIAAPFVEPRLFITRSGGAVESVPLTRVGERGFRAELACGDHVGRQQVEVNAEDATGATVLANFPLWCGEEPPATVTVELGDDATPVASGADAEARMLALVNRDRERHGLPPLQVDARVAAVARAHSEDMRRTGLVAHISPTTGSAADRVRAAGIRSAVILENVAQAYGVAEAEEALMNSPGHRANLLAKEVTHVGLGIVLGEEVAGRRELFVTQLFIRVAARLDATAAREVIVGKVRAARPGGQGGAALGEDAELGALAQDFAAALAAGGDAKAAAARSSERLSKLGAAYSKVTTVAITLSDLAAFDPSASLRDATILRYGVGIAQGDHPQMGEGALHVVLLLGHR